MDITVDGITFPNYRVQKHNDTMIIIMSDNTYVEEENGKIEYFGFKAKAIHKLQLQQQESSLKVFSYIN